VKLTFDLTWPIDVENEQRQVYQCCVDTFFFLCSYPRPLPSSLAAGLVQFQFTTTHRLHDGPGHGGIGIDPKALRQNVTFFYTGLRSLLLSLLK
jgi:hypothetical protein